METRWQIWFCLACNLLLTLTTLVIVVLFRDPSTKYFTYGPRDDLFIISICVNTWNKWWIVVLFISLSKVCDVLINEIGRPILGFTVYNPDKKEINDFTKNELNFLANAMFMISGIRFILMVVINVTQIDLAMIGMVVSEVTSIFTVRYLLNKKKFVTKKKDQCDIV